MNSPFETNEIEDQLASQAAELAGPRSSAPSLITLQERVSKRRRRRTLVRRSAAASSLAACALLAFIASKDLTNTNSTDDVPKVAANNTNSVDQSTKTKFDTQAFKEKMRLLARVRRPLPVFQMDRQNRQMRYVGWIEDEQTVPVNLEQLTNEQQATFRKMLDRRNIHDL